MPKVGTAGDVEYAEHERRREVAHDLGLSGEGRGPAGRMLTWGLGVIAVSLVVAAILFLALR